MASSARPSRRRSPRGAGAPPSDPLTAAKKQARLEKARADRVKRENQLAKQIQAAGFPEPQRQVILRKLHPVEADSLLDRGFVFDFAWPSYRLLVEVQGGARSARTVPCKKCKYPNSIRMGGAHNSPEGQTRDAEKAAHAAVLGYRLVPFTSDQLDANTAIPLLALALRAGGWEPSATE